MKLAILILVAAAVTGCAAPPLTGRPLTWAQVQRVGEVHVEDPTWKGKVLRLPVRVDRANTESPIVLQFKAAAFENLIYLAASRDDSDDPPVEVHEVLVELPESHLQQYFVVYANPDGGYERLRDVRIPETVREKLERQGGSGSAPETESPAATE